MTLYELIQSIPEAKVFADIGNDAACTNILNIKNQRGLVPIEEISKWSFLNGVAPVINAHSINTDSPLYGVCYTANAYFNNPRFQNIDLYLPQVTQMLNGLVQGGVLTQSQLEDLMTLAENRNTLAYSVLGYEIDLIDVSNAMSVDRPEGKIQ